MNIKEQTLKSLEYDKIIQLVSNYAKCSLSKVLCLEMQPSDNRAIIGKLLKYTKEARYILDLATDIPIEYVIDISNAALNVEYFEEQELIDFTKTLRTSRLVKSFLRENLEPDSQLNILASNLFVDRDIEDRISDTFDENYNIRQNATQSLSGLYSSLKETESQLKETVTKLLNSSEFNKHLQEQIYTMRDDRVVFQVKASSKNKVNGIVHDVSATSKTFYIEPSQIIPINNKIREVKSNIRAEIIHILINLTRLIKDNLSEIRQTVDILAEIDFYFAKARYSVKTSSIEPDLSDNKVIQIDEMRHPLLIGNVEKIVENDFYIGEDYKSVVITGSNTGGKTVTLKTVGLFLLMLKSGMFLPCGQAKIYPFKKVFADIGDEQNILQNLSTFSSHIKNVIEILNNSDYETVVLVDELCAGTDPQEGAILAEVILKKLKDLNAISLITTHYGELKSLEYTDSYFKNASVEFDTSTLSPTYKLVIGIPGLSNAISISSMLGLDKNLIDEAKSLMVNSKDVSNTVVEKLQDTHQKLTVDLEVAESARTEVEELKKDYEKKLSELKKEKNRTIKVIKAKFDGEMTRVKSEVKDILYEIRKDKTEKIARRSYSRLANLEHKFHKGVNEEVEGENYEEIDWSIAKVGDVFMLKELHQEVELVDMPSQNDKGKQDVVVLMGNIKTKIKKNKLAVYNNSLVKKPVVKKFAKPFESVEIKKYSMSNTLDLRGYRVEEALDDVESYLDKASLINLSPIFIIHGHGTGALKQAVRDFLKTSPYVAKYRPGEGVEGGDGVSVVDVK